MHREHSPRGKSDCLLGATPPLTVELVLRVRKQLEEADLYAGADTIGWHLTHHHSTALSRATIS